MCRLGQRRKLPFPSGTFCIIGDSVLAQPSRIFIIRKNLEDHVLKKLLAQIIKFGFVGVICFLIDFAISTGLVALLRGAIGENAAALAGGFFGFTISVVVNYILSMKYVFTRNEELGRKKEFVIFIILSIIGLGINELVIWICTKIYNANPNLADIIDFVAWFAAAKIIATAVVMVYNFISRKIFLEKHEN